ncbi:EamA family transporter [Paenactinomyces guangxiensis]|uniref:DMT family transporter n=1 Tax=Paenactinomyces guangxiensis TaxID=1490290 RepID=A0A7W1WPD1_9BACL|nr:DMT family transporter [Paenactinomyces guangxiensis]MBA4493585.1 DMT family transporter [Paenactinomyces guangxiensis]MBH8590872.1 DMT family transporter [Paenactinomyces guangxiensis]
MWFFLALLSSLTFGLAGFMMKASSARKGSTDHLLWGLYLSGTLGFLWWMYQTDVARFNMAILLAGLIIGFGSAAGNLLFMKALEIGPASLTSPLVNSNIVLTVGLSMWLYGERLSLFETIGVILLVIAVSLLPIDPNESLRIRGYHWYVLVLTATFLFFFRNGGLKVTEEMQLPNATVLFISYLFGLVWFTAEIFRKKESRRTEKIKTGIAWGLGSGIFSFAGMQIYAIALEDGPASIVAPIFATNSLVVAVLSIIIFRERLSLVQTICLILLFAGLIFIRLT